MAPVGALLYAAAGAAVAVSLLFPQGEEINRIGLIIASCSGFAAATAMWLARARLPRAAFQVTTAGGTLITGLCVYWSGEAVSPYAFLFLFVAIFTAYYFPGYQVALHLAFVGAVYAVALMITPGSDPDTASRWLLTMVATSIAAVVILRLVSTQRELEADRERLLARALEQARTDPLTGLLNRRAWNDELDRELARAARSGRRLCVAILDLDHFKRFNDEHGHLAGDHLLSAVASDWQKVVRPSDTIARYGGEEFAAVLPDCSIELAVEVIERLRGVIPLDQRCSAGIASWDGVETPLELIARADGRLYEAKDLGRDRIVSDSEGRLGSDASVQAGRG